MKARNEAKLLQDQAMEDRRKNLLLLMTHHLLDYGYLGAAEKLQAESGLSYQQYVVADNIDLITILQEYETYYNLKFNKKPKFARKRDVTIDAAPVRRQSAAEYTLPKIERRAKPYSAGAQPDVPSDESKPKDRMVHPKQSPRTSTKTNNAPEPDELGSLDIQVVKKFPQKRMAPNKLKKVDEKPAEDQPNPPITQHDEIAIPTKLIKPMPSGNCGCDQR